MIKGRLTGDAWDEMALLAVELCAQPPARGWPWRAESLMQPIGIFGGTFDPIHCGHLRTAFELWQELRLAEVRLLPAGTPPHRDQLYASAELRLQMVRAAVAAQPCFVVDDREVRRTGLSYSVDTLTELRARVSRSARCACCWAWMRSSACRNWHRWRELLSLAHVVVAHRPGWRAPDHRPARGGDGGSRHRQHPRAARAARRAASTCTPGRSWRFPPPSCVRCWSRAVTRATSFPTR